MSPAINQAEEICVCCRMTFPSRNRWSVDNKGPFCDTCGPQLYAASLTPMSTAMELVRLRKRLENESIKENRHGQ